MDFVVDSSDWAATLPVATSRRGATASIWRRRYDEQAVISSAWGSRLRGGRHLTMLAM